MKFKELLKLTGIPVFIASLCCLAPIVLVLLGVSTVAFAVSLVNVLDGQYKWAFILAGLFTLVISIIFYFRKRGVCTLDQAIRHRNEILNKTIITLITAIIGYIIFFYVILGYIGAVLHLW